MSNVTCSWVFGAVSSRQKPLAKVVIEGRTAPSLPFSELNQVAVPATSIVLADMAPGDWEFRATPVDTAGVKGPSSSAAVTVPSDAPSALVSFTAIAA